jgi:protein-tyrosine phosphatase
VTRRAAGGDPELLRPVLGVETIYLQTALDELRSRFGTIERYFADGLGIGADEQRALRVQLVE